MQLYFGGSQIENKVSSYCGERSEPLRGSSEASKLRQGSGGTARVLQAFCSMEGHFQTKGGGGKLFFLSVSRFPHICYSISILRYSMQCNIKYLVTGHIL